MLDLIIIVKVRVRNAYSVEDADTPHEALEFFLEAEGWPSLLVDAEDYELIAVESKETQQ